MLLKPSVNSDVIYQISRCFRSSWTNQAEIEALGLLGHGYMNPAFTFKRGPVDGLESVRAWVKCMLGYEEVTGPLGFLPARVRRWFSWVPQMGQSDVEVVKLLRAAYDGEAAAKFRLMGIGGAAIGSDEWVERVGNEAFRQSENMAEWANVMMVKYGIRYETIALFFLGLPLDGVLRGTDTMENLNLVSAAHVLWSTGLFRTPLDLAQVVLFARTRELKAPVEGSEATEEEYGPWGKETIWQERRWLDEFGQWLGQFFENQFRPTSEAEKAAFERAGITESSDPENHLYPEVVLRYLQSIPRKVRGPMGWIFMAGGERMFTPGAPELSRNYGLERDQRGEEIFRCIPEKLIL